MFNVAAADVMNINTIVIGNLRFSNVPILPLTDQMFLDGAAAYLSAVNN